MQHFELANRTMVLACSFNKRKKGGTQWLLQYTIHERCREMGLGALRDISLKQARESTIQWRFVLH
nr:Arm DNA-binding domain-containing protein [Bartonella koehlerae]